MSSIVFLIMWLYLLNSKTNAVAISSQKNECIYVHPGQLHSVLWHPDGIETGHTTYWTFIRRCLYKTSQYAGKLLLRPGSVPICVYSYDGKEIGETNFEVLSAPKGSLSWQEFDWNQNLPKNAVFAGRLVDANYIDRDSYICRGWVDDKKNVLVTGYYVQNYFVGYLCSIGFYGEHLLNKFEVLVKNEYGARMNY